MMNEKYNYYKAVKEDVLDYIENEIDFNDFEDIDELRDYLNETLWTEDSVTGNGSGSYTFSSWTAEEYLCHNLDLLEEASEDFGSEANILEEGAETCDVYIRCYVLGSCIDDAIDEIEEDFEESKEEEEA